jgi:hypothetical protein
MAIAALIVGIATAGALVASLVLVARQARSLATQTELANTIAALRASDDAVAGLRSIMLMFVRHPEARAFFYEGSEPPDAGEHEEQQMLRARVITLSELIADSLERAIQSTAALASPDRDVAGWEDVIDFYLRMSPALRASIAEHPMWWPSLDARRLAQGPGVS